MFMTAKVDMKKLLIIAGAVVAVILALVLLLGGSKDAADTAAPVSTGNDARVEFLKGYGWEVAASPTESGQVRIPQDQSEVFDRYNALQKSQGYDLSQYAGKTVMRYVYKVNNFPGATEPVYATLLIYKDQVIGGDVTNTAANGSMHALTKQSNVPQASAPAIPEATGASNA